MKRPRRTFIQWVAQMLSEGDGTPSTKRVCFLLAITSALCLCLGLFLRHGFEALVVDLAKSVLITAGAAYGITRWAEYGNGANPPQ